MSYQVIVEIKVINEVGDVVDHRGHPQISNKKIFTPLETKQDFKYYEHIESAHQNLNVLHAVIKHMKELS